MRLALRRILIVACLLAADTASVAMATFATFAAAISSCLAISEY
jgi:hypothetical protein